MGYFFAFILFVVSILSVNGDKVKFEKPKIPNAFGVNIHFTSGQEEQIKKIANAGFKWIRMDFIWNAVECEKGKYDFSDYDKLMADLDKHGIKAYFILDYGNNFYDGGAAPRNNETQEAFVKFVEASVKHFRNRNIVWEIWNEPNLDKFWAPKANPEDYVKLAKVVYDAVKRNDPNAMLVGPALSGWDFNFLENIFKLGFLENIDAVSLHPYGSAKPEDASKYFGTARQLISKYAPKNKKLRVLSGEWGYPAINEMSVDKQASYLVRMFLSNVMLDVPISIWYDWRDDGTDSKDPEHNYGVMFYDMREKPAYIAMSTLSRVLNGYEYSTRLASESDNDYILLMKNGDSFKLAIWTSGLPHTVSIPLDIDEVKLIAQSGECRQIILKNGILDVELKGEVQYVEPLTPSKRLSIEDKWDLSSSSKRCSDGIVVEVVSKMNVPQTALKISGEGLKEASIQIDDPKATFGETESKLSATTNFIWDGRQNPRLKAEVKVAEIKHPLIRYLPIDTTKNPRVTILPPAKFGLMAKIERDNVDSEFKGKLKIGNVSGLRAENETIDVVIPKGASESVVRIALTEDQAGIFAFSYNLLNDTGKTVFRSPLRRYSMIESFAEGKPGDDVRKYNAILDGDTKVKGSAKLTYVNSPSGAPYDICAKLEYKSESGWKFVRISPAHALMRLPSKPVRASIWIKSDDKSANAALRFTDSKGQTFQPAYGNLKFSDWRCLSAEMQGNGIGHWGGPADGIIRYPIQWDTIFVLDSLGQAMESKIFLGPVMVCYD